MGRQKLTNSDKRLNRANSLWLRSEVQNGLGTTTRIMGSVMAGFSIGSSLHSLLASYQSFTDQISGNQSPTAIMYAMFGLAFGGAYLGLKKLGDRLDQSSDRNWDKARDTFHAYVRKNPSTITRSSLAKKFKRLKDKYPVLGSHIVQINLPEKSR